MRFRRYRMVSVIHAMTSTSVIPGSLALKSVQSGHWLRMRTWASRTRSSNGRSSSFGMGRLTSRSGLEVERIDQVEFSVGGADPIRQRDLENAELVSLRRNHDGFDVYPWLPHDQRLVHGRLDHRARRPIHRAEHELMDVAAEVRPHDTFAFRGAEDDVDRLSYLLLVGRGRDATASVELDRKAPATAERCSVACHAS